MGDGTGILIVDDLVDSGKTRELVRRLLPKAHFATVYAKPHGKPQVDTYVTEVSQDTWIFFPWDMAGGNYWLRAENEMSSMPAWAMMAMTFWTSTAGRALSPRMMMR